MGWSPRVLSILSSVGHRQIMTGPGRASFYFGIRFQTVKVESIQFHSLIVKRMTVLSTCTLSPLACYYEYLRWSLPGRGGAAFFICLPALLIPPPSHLASPIGARQVCGRVRERCAGDSTRAWYLRRPCPPPRVASCQIAAAFNNRVPRRPRVSEKKGATPGRRNGRNGRNGAGWCLFAVRQSKLCAQQAHNGRPDRGARSRSAEERAPPQQQRWGRCTPELKVSVLGLFQNLKGMKTLRWRLSFGFNNINFAPLLNGTATAQFAGLSVDVSSSPRGSNNFALSSEGGASNAGLASGGGIGSGGGVYWPSTPGRHSRDVSHGSNVGAGGTTGEDPPASTTSGGQATGRARNASFADDQPTPAAPSTLSPRLPSITVEFAGGDHTPNKTNMNNNEERSAEHNSRRAPKRRSDARCGRGRERPGSAPPPRPPTR